MLTSKSFCESGRLLFFACVLLLASFYLLMLVFRLSSPGGDTFLHMSNLFATSSGVAQGEWAAKWFPKSSFGTTGLFAVSGCTPIVINIFDLTLALTGLSMGNIPNFSHVYFFNMFFSELVLLLGAWLLSRRLFDSALTAFYVTVSVVATSIWLEQEAFAFATFAPVPLVLYYFHKAVDTGNAKPLLCASLLALYSSINIINYGAIFQLLMYATYMATYFAVAPGKLRQAWVLFKPTLWGVFAVLLILVCVAATIYSSIHDIQNADLSVSLREAGGVVPLSVFNSMGKNLGLTKYMDLLRGVNSNQPDLALFRGFLVMALLPLSLRVLPKAGWPIFATAMIIFCTSFGSNLHVSTLLWYVFPGMRYVRYLGFLAPTATFLFCFVSGYGFQALLRGQHRAFFLKSALPMLLAALVLCVLATQTTHIKPGYVTPAKAWFSCAVALGLGALVFLFARRERQAGLILGVMLLVHVADVTVYRANILLGRAQWQTPAELALWDFFTPEYQTRRQGGDFDSERGRILLPQFAANYPTVAYYASISTLLDHEPAKTGLFVLERQGCVAEFFRLFPACEDGPCAAMAGISRAKLQFFTQAYFAPAGEVGALISGSGYQGGLPCLEGVGLRDQAPGGPSVALLWNPAAAAQVAVPFAVDAYTPNRLALSFPHLLGQATWIYYADGWNARWHVRVGGVELPLYRADVGFKAALLPAGATGVSFTFEDKLLDLAVLANRLASLLVFVWVSLAAGRALLRRGPEAPAL